MMITKERDFVIYHLSKALEGALAEADGDEASSRRLHASTKLRLVTMSSGELLELAKLVAFPPRWPFEMAYVELMNQIEEIKLAKEWTEEIVGIP
jgi:hypothetical protein